MSPPPTRRRRGRPTDRTPAQTRDLILDAAIEAFAASGYHAPSMSSLAARAGVSVSGLLHHFPTKVDVLTAILERRDRIDVARIENFDPVPRNPFGVLDRIRTVLVSNLERHELVRLFTVLAGEAFEPDHPGHGWLVSHHELVRSGIERNLDNGLREGTVQPGLNAQLIATTVVALLDGLQIQWLIDPERIDMVAAYDTYVAGLRTLWEIPDRES